MSVSGSVQALGVRTQRQPTQVRMRSCQSHKVPTTYCSTQDTNSVCKYVIVLSTSPGAHGHPGPREKSAWQARKGSHLAQTGGLRHQPD